jgi:hypothetical protein
MVVRIKMKNGERIAAVAPKVAEVTDLAGALMTPASLLAFVFAAWSLAADLGMAGQFAFTRGVFSHWMVWLAVGVVLQMIGVSVRSRTMPMPAWLKHTVR